MGLWNWPWSTGPSGFGSSSTAEEVTEGIDASHLTVIVTAENSISIIQNLMPGATNGIGKETARVLALRGAKVIMPSRTLESGMKAKESLLEQNPNSKLDVMEMDLSSLESVRKFAQSFNSRNKHLNILINNAGIMACPFQLSKDGIELQFATNHLGHYLLTSLLLDKLKTTAKETGIQGRIINVSSTAHRSSDGSFFDLEKLNDQSRYKPFGAYAHSKLANILHANELSRRLQEEGSDVTANSLHPGVIVTNIGRYLTSNAVVFTLLATLVKPFVKSIPQGAATTCYLALHPNLKDVSGKYFANCNETTPSAKARDGELGKRLWEFSEELLQRSSKATK
ncbi:short-chain dehydrogenase TIC 32, chloroplastic-like isoform X2 [Ananas comosus]|uniref:Short-chain dehydrogenase TIC 32, chloroplastic-like isoform X2 n=1 Tax=Ananas comosus TaxID=4615 RepID=A0A6P5GP38_ANACO|nr:short-chain dehydrogenase TIC 32, chloroplastic-like isoform X2 [Ananas comosus]